MKWLNYHHLMYFRTIAEEGSIAKASETLSVGQPALSAQLKTLEESFGTQLFERKNRRLILTEAGKVVLTYAHQINDLGRELLNTVEDRSFQARPHIRLGGLDSVPKHLLFDLVTFARGQNKAHISVFEGQGDELFRQLDTHEVDIIVSNHVPGLSRDKSLVYRSMGKFGVGIYGAKKFSHLSKGFPHSLKGYPMIVPTRHSKLRHDLDHYFDLHKIFPEYAVETQDTSLQKLMGISGMGLIPIPYIAAKNLVKEKKLHLIGTLKQVYDEYLLVSAKRWVENPYVARVVNEYKISTKVKRGEV